MSTEVDVEMVKAQEADASMHLLMQHIYGMLVMMECTKESCPFVQKSPLYLCAYTVTYAYFFVPVPLHSGHIPVPLHSEHLPLSQNLQSYHLPTYLSHSRP